MCAVSLNIPVGTVFGRYEIRSLVGSGGMGEVYLAHDMQLKRPVALKLISAEAIKDETLPQRLEQEARAASALNHPNILTVHEIGEVGVIHFIATEYIDGVTLRRHMNETEMLLTEILNVIVQLASALAAAQDAGIVHRDIKPENIMIRPDGYIKVLDFGIAKVTHQTNEPDNTGVGTAPNILWGTARYMSPEQARGFKLDSRTDIWSTGIVLYEMTARRVPFLGKTPADTILSILTDPLVPLSTYVKEEIPIELERIVAKALTKDRRKRYQTVQALLFDLKNLQLELEFQKRTRRSTQSVRYRNTATRRAHQESGSWDESPTFENCPNNLPVQVMPFIGRDHEVTTVTELLQREEVRLLTLTGPGGTGKTRLGLRVATELLGEFENGIFFIPLAAINDAELIASTIAQTLRVTEAGGNSPLECLKEFLRDKHLLLFFDNFEQVLSAAPILGQLLMAAPRLKMLVTSRAALHINGEREYLVPPMALPDIERTLSTEALLECASVALFVERARAAKPDFTFTAENGRVIAEICHRLDGLPLAIELAAARIKLLPPQAMLARLENRLKLLTGGARDLPLRQQTMRATIEWGYNLLNDQEKLLFQRLTVFVGGFTLEAAEAVCNGAGNLEIDILDGVASLVDKSLLRQSEQAGDEPRFAMLETIREYGSECLASSGELIVVRNQHAKYYLLLAERAELELAKAGQQVWLDRLEKEHDNLRAMLEWTLKFGEAALGLQLASAIWWFWYLRGYYSEGRRWLDETLAQSPDAPPHFRTRALIGAGVLSFLQCEYVRAEVLLEESLALARELGDRHSIASSLQFLGSVAREQGHYEKAIVLHEESLALWRDLQDKRGIARSLNYIGFAAWLQGDFDQAQRVCEETLALFRRLDDKEGCAWAMLNLGIVAYYRNEYEQANLYCKESLEMSREVKFKEGIAWALNFLGNIAQRQGYYERAATLLQKSLAMHWKLGDKWRMASVLDALGSVACAQAAMERAAWLGGAAEALRETLGAPLPPVERTDRERNIAIMQTTLGTQFITVWRAGREMTIEQALACALSPAAKT
ncbi:MAG: protein kinase [Acidobacteriota bacterium]